MLIIRTKRLELEIYSNGYLNWLRLDIGRSRHTVYRDLDGRLAKEVIARPRPISA